jgi:hypothetical protein
MSSRMGGGIRMKDWKKEKDYNDSDEILFISDQISLGEYATLPNSSLTLGWFEGGGQVYIGRPFMRGQSMHKVSNPLFDWASSKKEFRDLAQRFAAGGE